MYIVHGQEIECECLHERQSHAEHLIVWCAWRHGCVGCQSVGVYWVCGLLAQTLVGWRGCLLRDQLPQNRWVAVRSRCVFVSLHERKSQCDHVVGA